MKNENFGLVLSTKESDDKKTARIIGTDMVMATIWPPHTISRL